jgi:hypothetical protein
LEEDERNQLKAPWKNLGADNSFELPEDSKGDRKMKPESNKHSRILTEGGRQTRNNTDIERTVGQVIDKTKQKLRDYQTLPQTNLNAAAFRRKAKEVLVSALAVKDFIGAVLSLDPTGYGASAWTVMSFALTVG